MLLHVKLEITGIEGILAFLANINRKVDKIMANQADLDAALAGLVQDIKDQTAAIDAAAQKIIDAIAQSGTPVDLSAEIQTITDARAALDAVAGQLPTTPTPPPAP